MENLIKQLKKEHATLVTILEEVQKFGVSSEEAKQLLLKAKSTLLAHLKKEDEQLYPVLKKVAKEDDETQRKLNSFAKDMYEITTFTLLFFNKIEKGLYTQMDYLKDFGRLVSVLSSRIRREETILYAMYEKSTV